MKHYYLFLILILTLNSPVKSQIREVPVPTLPDIAIASWDKLGPVIYYNPGAMQSVGPLAAEFVRAHEYGHHVRGHIVGILSGNYYVQNWLTLNMENDADSYAVNYWITNGRKDIIQAGATAYWQWNNIGDQTHPPSRIRAQNIMNLYQALTNSPLFP